ncbi:hypothetical protein EPZ47_03020 [Pseudomonas viciae]|uniref:Uncharacterized protein n=1 Tax=Pseudomonas viciae TaxID=2505979 RepID=A0A4P7PBI4_9PSED|nr:hypothetical protein EPZ47_03020 [Pseudomonas viciae]
MEERPYHPESGVPEFTFLWEQSLLAMNDNPVLLIDRGAAIASKLCSHRVDPTGICVLSLNFLSALMDCTWT